MKKYTAPAVITVLTVIRRPKPAPIVFREPEVRHLVTPNRKQELADQFHFKRKGFRKSVR